MIRKRSFHGSSSTSIQIQYDKESRQEKKRSECGKNKKAKDMNRSSSLEQHQTKLLIINTTDFNRVLLFTKTLLFPLINIQMVSDFILSFDLIELNEKYKHQR